MNNKKASRIIKALLQCVLGGAILSFGLFNVHSHCQITEGGILGLTLLLEHWLKLSPGISGAVLNLLCYAFGIKVFGKGFILYSSVSAFSFSAFYCVWEGIGPLFSGLEAYPAFACLAGAAFVGVGAGLCVRAGGAPCGDDAFAMTMARISGKDIRIFYLLSDLAVLGFSISYLPLRGIAFSLVSVIISWWLIGVISRFKKE